MDYHLSQMAERLELHQKIVPLVSQSTFNVMYVTSCKVQMNEHVKATNYGVAHSLLAIVSKEWM